MYAKGKGLTPFLGEEEGRGGEGQAQDHITETSYTVLSQQRN